MAGSIINTFDKGIHQDSAFILQPDGTYRNMKNGMLISYDGNHYTIEMTKGNKVLFTLPPIYKTDRVSLAIPPLPIGFASFIDKLVVFSTNNESETGYGEIGVVTFTRVGDDFTASYVPYYNHAELNFTKLHKIEAWTITENDLASRVYFTDNFNEPRVFNISDTIFTTYKLPATANELVIGKKYMVLTGAILYNGVEYGCGLTAGNIFTATSLGGTSYTVSFDVPTVIEYYDLSLLSWAPDRLLGSLKFKEYGSGSKNYGSNIYFYRISSAKAGYTTGWSYASSPIHVGGNNVSAFLSTAEYANFVGDGNSTSTLVSDKSIIVSISGVDTRFDTIELACAEFLQEKDIPYIIKIVSKIPITGETMDIEDNGVSNLGTVTISDLTLFPASIKTCKTGATNKNYNVIANITEREEFDLDLSGVTLGQVEYPMLYNADPFICQWTNDADIYVPKKGVNPGFQEIYPNTRYLVTANGAGDIEYPSGSGIYYTLGEVFTGVSTGTGKTSANIPFGLQFTSCRPCTTRNRYTVSNPLSPKFGKRVEDAIELTSAFWDYKDPAVAAHNKGYWSTEKYRFAFLAFDLKGNPFYARHIGDYTFSDIFSKGGLATQHGSDNWNCLNPSGLNVSGLDIPESIMNQMSGFSIVRAERDPIVITQGLLMQNVVDVPNNRVMPLPLTQTNNSIFPLYSSANGPVLSYISPDDLVNYDFADPIGVIGQKIKEAYWTEGTLIKSYGNKYTLITRMFDSYEDADSPREAILNSFNGRGSLLEQEDGSTANFDNTGRDYFNTFSPVNNGLVNGSFGSVDDYCTGRWDWVDGNSAYVTGCKKRIFQTNFGQINHYGSALDYSDQLQEFNHKKIVVNFITNSDATNQYGGDTDVALADTLYMSTGHFQPINTSVKADTLNGVFVGGPYDGENKYTFNNIEIFGGDCFTNMVDVGYGLWNDDFLTAYGGTYAYSLWFPCEGNVNYNLRRGRKVSNVGMYFNGTQVEAVGYDTPNGIKLESYSYNQGYSTEGTFVKYPALPADYKFTGNFDYRMRWAGPKYPGEINDSFRTFRIPDYRDLDGQRGQINNLKTRDSKLFYWQDHSVGYTPILERQLVGGSALGEATALGVTGVIDRFDDIDTYFGNQHQHGLTETEYGFAWFDMRRRAFMVMGIGSKPEEMSMVKGLQVFFNNEFNEGEISYPSSFSTIYNTNNLDIPEAPLMGYGIVGCYDPTFKMTYLTFKYKRKDIDESNFDTIITKDFTLGYNHILNAFVSFVDNCPAIWHNHNDLVLTANDPKFTKSFNVNMPSTSYVIGDTIGFEGVSYICISPVTILSYPGTLIGTKTSPFLAPSSDYWVILNEENQVYLQNFGAELCKFYGKVFDHELDVVVNAKTDLAVTAQNYQFKATGPNWTDVTASTDDQTASDLNISTTNRNYRWIDKSWFASLPLPTNGRLTDYYVRIKFTFKNYVSVPTTAKNVQKISQWLKTTFVSKR